MNASDASGVDLTLSERDLMAFTEYTYRKSRINRRHILRRRWRPFSWVLLVVGTAVVVDVFDDPRALTDSHYWLIMLAGASVCGVIWAFVSPWLYLACIRLQAWWRFRDGTFRSVLQPSRIEILPEGLKSTGALGSQVTSWHAILDVETTRDALYVYVNSLFGHIIPRRAFATDESFDLFASKVSEFRHQFGTSATGA